MSTLLQGLNSVEIAKYDVELQVYPDIQDVPPLASLLYNDFPCLLQYFNPQLAVYSCMLMWYQLVYDLFQGGIKSVAVSEGGFQIEDAVR